MGLKDKVVRALALRFARGKIKDLRGKDRETGMGKVLKFLDGWKLVIAVIGIAAAKAWDMAHNGHAGDALGIAFSLLGWTPGADWSILARDLGTNLLAVVAIGHKLFKAQRQIAAGASVSETLSAEGYIAKTAEDAAKA